jgi:PAS domain S-box-containing protein
MHQGYDIYPFSISLDESVRVLNYYLGNGQMNNEPEIEKETGKLEKLPGIFNTSQNNAQVEQSVKQSSETSLGMSSNIHENSIDVLGKTHANNNKKNTNLLRDLSEKYRLIALHTSDLISFTTFDVDPIFTFVSPSHKKILGFEADDLLGKSGLDFIHEDDKQNILTILLAYIDAKINGVLTDDMVENAPQLDFRFRDKSGQWHFLQSTVDIVNDELLFISKDITEQKHTEAELHEKLDKLQKSELATLNIMEDLQDTIIDLRKAKEEINLKNKELQTINQELNVARNQLAILNQGLEAKVQERTFEVEELLKQKDDFINQLGHDLKTPLTPLNTLLPLMKQRENDLKLQEFLDICISNVNYMRNLVNRTLELARLNSPSTVPNIESISLVTEVNDVLKSKQSIFLDKNISVKNNIDDQLIVQADSVQIKELFDNIIVNAVKYSKPSENLHIFIDAKKEENDIVISIKDTGIGMSCEQLEHIFHEFYKADSSRHNLESTGLGLSICKRIIEKHSGKIWAESPGLGKGSTFYFSLPITKKKTV